MFNKYERKMPTLSNKSQYYNYFDGVNDEDIIDSCFEQILYLNEGIDKIINELEEKKSSYCRHEEYDLAVSKTLEDLKKSAYKNI